MIDSLADDPYISLYKLTENSVRAQHIKFASSDCCFLVDLNNSIKDIIKVFLHAVIHK